MVVSHKFSEEGLRLIRALLLKYVDLDQANNVIALFEQLVLQFLFVLFYARTVG